MDGFEALLFLFHGRKNTSLAGHVKYHACLPVTVNEHILNEAISVLVRTRINDKRVSVNYLPCQIF